jgi:hypothetical protein
MNDNNNQPTPGEHQGETLSHLEELERLERLEELQRIELLKQRDPSVLLSETVEEKIRRQSAAQDVADFVTLSYDQRRIRRAQLVKRQLVTQANCIRMLQHMADNDANRRDVRVVVSALGPYDVLFRCHYLDLEAFDRIPHALGDDTIRGLVVSSRLFDLEVTAHVEDERWSTDRAGWLAARLRPCKVPSFPGWTGYTVLEEALRELRNRMVNSRAYSPLPDLLT